MSTKSIVIIGGGHASAQLCAALVELKTQAKVHLVCEEEFLPYQRPPLSKAYFKNPQEGIQSIKAAAWFEQHSIEVHLHTQASMIDAKKQEVRLSSGEVLSYDKLVLATGTKARRLDALPETLNNVHVLRTAKDAQALRERIEQLNTMVFIGGGFIGLELAATFNALGKKAIVLEVAPRLLARSISEPLSEHVLQTHRLAGVDIRLNSNIKDFEFKGDEVVQVHLDNESLDCDGLLLGIGATAQVQLALQAGLVCNEGVVVDEHMRTSDANIYAIGDCARFPSAWVTQGHLRLESIQNANDQARVAALNLTGQSASYESTPWFWSEQGAMRLQMVGLYAQDLSTVLRPGASAQSFSLFHYSGHQLRCVESVNAPMEHMMAKKMFEQKVSPSPEDVANPQVALKSLVS